MLTLLKRRKLIRPPWRVNESIRRYLDGEKNKIKGISVSSTMKTFIIKVSIHLPNQKTQQWYVGKALSKIEAVCMLRAAEQCLALQYPVKMGHLAGKTEAAKELTKLLLKSKKGPKRPYHRRIY